MTLAGYTNPATQSFQVQIGGNNSAVIGAGGFPISNANIQDAINAIPGFAGTATVSGAANTGFTVAFSGASANTDVASLSIVNCTAPCTSTVRESVKGGTGVAGWPAGGTVAVGTVADTGYTLTFGGSHQGTNVSALTVTNGTGGASGTVAETTAGAPGMLPVGSSVTSGAVDDTGFTLTFPTYAGVPTSDVSPFTVTNQVTWAAPAYAAAVRETVKGTAAVAGWPVGGTVTAAALYAGVTAPNLSDEGFKLTFAGTLAAANVATTVGVTNGTGGVRAPRARPLPALPASPSAGSRSPTSVIRPTRRC